MNRFGSSWVYAKRPKRSGTSAGSHLHPAYESARTFMLIRLHPELFHYRIECSMYEFVTLNGGWTTTHGADRQPWHRVVILILRIRMAEPTSLAGIRMTLITAPDAASDVPQLLQADCSVVARLWIS
jgi:hypothetical protein